MYSVYISGWPTSAALGITCEVLLAALQQTTDGCRSPARVIAGGAPARQPRNVHIPWPCYIPTMCSVEI
ncbi:hypothetical protein Y032_0094g2701 [Ancylostoma ceylanicum]|uniref:Uncharacterized protein n=1 Tax=Ancylostoma ceylanicum TaxID=53326 RepID=A0A016TK13_9BILA|nr:hypothetical protein Y032_0094g2701 [Ancylostoma ceylanicum]